MSAWTAEHVLSALALVGAAIAFAIGLLQYRRAQHWKRAEWVAQEMKSLFGDPVVQAVLLMMDWGSRRIALYPDHANERDRHVLLTNDEVARALMVHDERPEPFSNLEADIRAAFDRLLDGLERLHSYVDTGLVELDDLRPYLRYWAVHIYRPREQREETHRLERLRVYMRRYGYDGAHALLSRIAESERPLPSTAAADAPPRKPDAKPATVGLVGGLGPESTIDYYRRILAEWERVEPGRAPSIVVDSLDVRRALGLVESDRLALAAYLRASVQRLVAAGADFVAMTANTPHIVFDELAAASPVPMVSIVEACAREAQRRGLARPLLLGTRFTMEAPFYPEVFARHGITVVVPADADRAWLHERYVGELLRGDFRDETRRAVVALVERMRGELTIDGVILGGTELPLLLAGAEIAGLPALDTTALHVAAIVERLR